jgi:hypothetical protein
MGARRGRPSSPVRPRRRSERPVVARADRILARVEPSRPIDVPRIDRGIGRCDGSQRMMTESGGRRVVREASWRAGITFSGSDGASDTMADLRALISSRCAPRSGERDACRSRGRDAWPSDRREGRPFAEPAAPVRHPIGRPPGARVGGDRPCPSGAFGGTCGSARRFYGAPDRAGTGAIG